MAARAATIGSHSPLSPQPGRRRPRANPAARDPRTVATTLASAKHRPSANNLVTPARCDLTAPLRIVLSMTRRVAPRPQAAAGSALRDITGGPTWSSSSSDPSRSRAPEAVHARSLPMVGFTRLEPKYRI